MEHKTGMAKAEFSEIYAQMHRQIGEIFERTSNIREKEKAMRRHNMEKMYARINLIRMDHGWPLFSFKDFMSLDYTIALVQLQRHENL
jgi:hypothetical protein